MEIPKWLVGPEALENVSEPDLLQRVLLMLPDGKLLWTMETQRRGRRDDYPIRVCWGLWVAFLVYKHRRMRDLLREARRNIGLRMTVGILTADEVPEEWVMSRFVAALSEHRDLLEEMIDNLIGQLKEALPDLGKESAVDSTKMHTYARGKKDPEDSADPEADWGVKTRKVKKADGTVEEKVSSWFGYKLHLIVDAVYELPLGLRVTPASTSDISQMQPLVEEGERRGLDIEALMADAGYDGQDNHKWLVQEKGIRPYIDMQDHPNQEPPTYPGAPVPKTVYDRDRLTHILDSRTDQYVELTFAGYDQKNQRLKYRCPCGRMRQEGTLDATAPCPFYPDVCMAHKGATPTSFWIALKENWRYYTPTPRESKRWKKQYSKRVGVEHVNGRMKDVLRIDDTAYRGLARHHALALSGALILLAHALSVIQAGRAEQARSLMVA